MPLSITLYNILSPDIIVLLYQIQKNTGSDQAFQLAVIMVLTWEYTSVIRHS